jgi:isoaspartyl peptidase/L-asparaginase-like protein (Ntn-hydrolase superfamily)
MERCLSARRAANIEVQNASKRLMGNAGVIAIKGKGRIASVHNIPLMPWAYSTAKMKKPQTKPQGKIVALLSSSLSR